MAERILRLPLRVNVQIKSKSQCLHTRGSVIWSDCQYCYYFQTFSTTSIVIFVSSIGLDDGLQTVLITHCMLSYSIATQPVSLPKVVDFGLSSFHSVCNTMIKGGVKFQQ